MAPRLALCSCIALILLTPTGCQSSRSRGDSRIVRYDTASGDRMPSEQNRPATLSEQMANSRQSPQEGTPNPSGRSELDLAGDRTSEQAFVQVAFQDTTPESPSANSARAKLAQQPDDAPPVAPPLPTIPGTPTPLPGSGNQGVISPALPAEQIPEEISPGVEAAPLNQRGVTLE
ncbi:MAG: hypothetical protein ACKO0N_08810, partial [Planctomycetota bacterium]